MCAVSCFMNKKKPYLYNIKYLPTHIIKLLSLKKLPLWCACELYVL